MGVEARGGGGRGGVTSLVRVLKTKVWVRFRCGGVPGGSGPALSSSLNSPAIPSYVLCSSVSAASLAARRCPFSWVIYSLFTVLGPVFKRLLVLCGFTFLPLYFSARSSTLIGRSYLINTFLLILMRLS
jgi:hypothetical protein